MAEFVARNGPEFETITKAKQQSNPRFSFLFGGEFYQYYQWRVSAEQARMLDDINSIILCVCDIVIFTILDSFFSSSTIDALFSFEATNTTARSNGTTTTIIDANAKLE